MITRTSSKVFHVSLNASGGSVTDEYSEKNSGKIRTYLTSSFVLDAITL